MVVIFKFCEQSHFSSPPMKASFLAVEKLGSVRRVSSSWPWLVSFLFLFFLLPLSILSPLFVFIDFLSFSYSQGDTFVTMYVAYCKNKPFSNSLLIEHGGNFFSVSNNTIFLDFEMIFVCNFSHTASVCLRTNANTSNELFVF